MDVEDRNGVTIARLHHGPVNALDVDYLRQITETLRSLAASSLRAVILTGAGTTVSAGADLKRVVSEERAYVESGVHALSECFGTLFNFPRPVVAAVNGPAIAGGCVLACACDYRVASSGAGLIGLAELAVGVPFPSYALEIVRFATPAQHFQKLVYLAESFPPDEARRQGLVDEVVEPDRLLDRATELAERLAAIPAGTFEVVKRLVRRPTVDRVERYSREHDAEAARLWGSKEVRESISDFMDRLRTH